MINVVRVQFPDASHHGCLFHLGQNLWRHIQKSGFASRYGNDSDFALRLRHILALAYLPVDQIPDAFEQIKQHVLPEDAEPVTEWFEMYYIKGRPHSHINGLKVTVTWSSPLFPPHLWSIHEQVELRLPRTQNNVEAWHRRWNALLNNNRYGLYSTVRHLMKEQVNTNHIIERSQAGIEKTPPKKIRRVYSHAIQRICENRVKMDTLDFLRGIANVTVLC